MLLGISTLQGVRHEGGGASGFVQEIWDVEDCQSPIEPEARELKILLHSLNSSIPNICSADPIVSTSSQKPVIVMVIAYLSRKHIRYNRVTKGTMYQSIRFLRTFSSASVHSSSNDDKDVVWPGEAFSSSEILAFSIDMVGSSLCSENES
jgi:hypothetical protein